ncbi:MAG: glycosyltransferase [Bacteroidales bacterium]|nr:glycosyltransferase [Bacteroidales bacterium]
MKVVQINAIYGSKSTGTIVKGIQSCCEAHGIECYVAYSITDGPDKEVPRGYRIGNKLTAKWHALISRVFGKQAYFNRLTTWKFLRWLDKVNPDVVHLHNLHSNYIHLNMLLRYLAKHNIATVITMHDCWYFTGGCMHYASIGCQRWQTGCGQCPKWRQIPSYFFDRTQSVLKDRKQYLSAIPRLTMVGASEWIANEMKQSLLKDLNITFIHNGFDLNIFSPSVSDKRKDLGIANKFVILGPASKWLLPINKPTLDYFVSRMSDDMVLVLFGCTQTNNALPSNFVQIGYTKSPKEMAELYSMADVFVNCSREDTLSSLNLECQACGTPVVTYDATGSKETVDGECGFAVSTGDYEDLWGKVLEVRLQGKDSLTKQCRQWASGHFEKKSNYEKYIALYRSSTI